MSRTCNILWVGLGKKLFGFLRHRPIFVPKSCCSLKNIRFLHEIRLGFLLFFSKSWCSLKKNKSSPKICPRFFTFHPKIVVFSKKKSSPRITSPFSNFVPKQRCSLLGSEIKVMAQKFVGHAKHDLHALAARRCTQAQLNVFCLNVF